MQGHRSIIQKRQTVSYCLYLLDKAVCWIDGTFPSVSRFNVYIMSDATGSSNKTAVDFVAKAKLAEIEEIIYANILKKSQS